MPAVSFGNEPRPKHFESGFFEPGKVRISVGMAPRHWRAVPVLFSPRPRPGPDGREQVPTWPEPLTQLLKHAALLVDRDVNDREEGNDGHEALGSELGVGHVLAEEPARRDQSSGAFDLDRRDIDD